MNIYILNTLAIGQDTSLLLLKQLDIRGIIGLSERQPGDAISDYLYQKEFCKKTGVDFVEASSYTLSDERDKAKLLSLDIDVLIITGWQRLLPDWLIQHCKLCIIGSHGSPFGITQGRGRSPQNWALILGAKEFYISIFKIDKHIDSGDIIDTQKFPLTLFDDIRTSYYKVSWLTAHMIAENIKNGNIARGQFTLQKETHASYFPQRLPEDGQIDWHRSSIDIYNFIRALTKPYPGAFSKCGQSVLKIWKAIPFEVKEAGSAEPGEIVKIFNKGELLIKTGDGFILASEYEAKDNAVLTEGLILESLPFKENMERIIRRHRTKYPELRISDEILKLAT